MMVPGTNLSRGASGNYPRLEDGFAAGPRVDRKRAPRLPAGFMGRGRRLLEGSLRNRPLNGGSADGSVGDVFRPTHLQQGAGRPLGQAPGNGARNRTPVYGSVSAGPTG